RLVELFGVEVEAELQGTMIYIVNTDTPGFIGRLGTALGEAGINIATFNLGRREALGEAVALVSVDGDVPPEMVAALAKLEGVRDVVALRFWTLRLSARKPARILRRCFGAPARTPRPAGRPR